MPNIDVLRDEPYLEPGTVRIAVYNTVQQANYWKHSHNFFEFVYVTDGFSLHSYNNDTSILTGGDLFAIYPGNIHAYIAANNAKIYNILFYLDELGEFGKEIAMLPGIGLGEHRKHDHFPIVRVGLPERTELTFLLDSLVKERKERQDGWELRLKAQLMSFLVMFSRLVCENGGNASNDKRGYCRYIYNVLSYVSENYSREIDSAALARVSGLSADHLARQFKSVMSMTPIEYLRRFRVAKAMDMLKATGMPIADIATAVGFGDISIFSRVFKQTVGVSPAVFRKE